MVMSLSRTVCCDRVISPASRTPEHCALQAKAPMPVMSRPTISAWIVSVPS
jgi:hypothetical protein